MFLNPIMLVGWYIKWYFQFVKHLVEILDHVSSDMSCAIDGAILNGLNSLRDSAQDSELHTWEGVLGALEVVHLQAQVPDQVEVDEGHWGDRQLWCWEHCKWPALDSEDKFFHIWRVVLAGRLTFSRFWLLHGDFHFSLRFFFFDSVLLALILKAWPDYCIYCMKHVG